MATRESVQPRHATVTLDEPPLPGLMRSAIPQNTASMISTLKAVRAFGVTTLKKPSVLLSRKRYLLLLSHPRGYTSLLSHILGSHPDIVGSSETFDSYVTTRDLLRLRYKAYWLNDRKSGGKYVFDKVLYNFPISSTILNRHNVNVIFTLRKPLPTIRSMIKAHHDVGTTDVFWRDYGDVTKCCELYVDRLKTLEEHCLVLKRKALYFDAEDLMSRTAEIFQALKSELHLSQELSEEYRTFSHTGTSGGDYSARIKLGRMSRTESGDSPIAVPDHILEYAQDIYDQCRSVLRARCICP